MNNRLFCTFTTEEQVDEDLENIRKCYYILYNKIFLLSYNNGEGYLCTYNVDTHNVGNFIENTILVHRKKNTNTLYTINALNELIKSLNRGILNKNFNVNWNDYRNCILITREGGLEQMDTELEEIIEL